MPLSNYQISRRRFLRQVAASSAFLPFLSFRDLQGSKLRFGLVTDSHYAEREPHNTRYYRQALLKMEEFVEQMNKEQVDFIMHMGDFKDEDPQKQERDTLEYLQKIESVYAGFQGPRFHCVGNHDVDSITKQQFLAHTTNTGIPTDRSYYSFDKLGYHFVVLDANYHDDGRDHFFQQGADWQDTNISKEQLAWLKQDLAKTSYPCVIFCHHPLFEYHREGFKFHVNQYQEVQQLIKGSRKVIGVFQGHVHEEKYQKIEDVHYFTQLALVDFEGLENNSFSIVEVDRESLTILGYKRVSNQKIKL